MLREAVTIASKYTFPIVLSRMDVAGAATSSVGAFVVINRDGWIVTAGHMIDQLGAMVNDGQTVADHEAQVATIRADATLTHKEKQKTISKLGNLDPKLTRRSGAWWGMPDPDVELKDAHVISTVDIAVGRLEPFDPNWVTEYPKFKDPTKDFRPGMTLGKLGYPFHALSPTWNAVSNKFEYPAGTLPPESFPIDGIFSRAVVVDDPVAHGFPLKWVVSSTPGLKGQSGGPTFDTKGVVCAIQCRTQSLSLGFDPEAPGKPGVPIHQFLNVGLGVHPTTLYGLFNKLGIAFDAAPD